MPRTRAYSDPSSPSLGSTSRPPTTHYTSYFSHDSTTSFDAPPVPLSQGALAALTAESSQPNFALSPPFSGVGPYAGFTHRARRTRAPSLTPSTTSVSDDEDDKFELADGFEREEEVEERLMPLWAGSKGKGKAMDVDVDGKPGRAGSLPPEILSQIFRSLSDPRDLLSVILTSRSWCLSAFQYLWIRPTFTSAHQLAMFVQVLDSPRMTLPYASQVRRINLQSIAGELTDNLIAGLRGCHRVERLTLTKASQLTSFTLQKVIDGMPDLVAIDLCEVGGTDDNVLKLLADRCPRIQGVNLSGCKSISDQGVLALAIKSKLLKRLKLSGCHRLTDVSLTMIARKCLLLLETDLGNVPQLGDPTVYGIFLNTVHLRELRLNQNAFLTDRAFPNLPELFDASDEDLENAAGQYANVVCRPVPADSTEGAQGHMPSRATRPLQAAEIIPAYLRPRTETFEHLRQVDLTGCNLLTDKAIQNLVANAPKLRNLTLAKCSALTDGAVISIAKLGKHLHYLHLGHVGLITDVAVTKLARSCTRLRYIDLACCPLLTDLSVFELATNLPKLRRIGLVKVTKITDEGIHALAERHSSLERLHLSYCQNVSVAAISFLLNRLLKLTHLSLTGIPAFKTTELKQFCRPPPPDFDERQRASFCVYSGPGIPELRSFLNAQMAANTAPGSDDASTRRGSGSSASSVTVPGAGSPSSMDPRVRTHAPSHSTARAGSSRETGTVSQARRVSAPAFREVTSRSPFGVASPTIPALSSAFATSTPNFLHTPIHTRIRVPPLNARDSRGSSTSSVNLDPSRDPHGGYLRMPGSMAQNVPMDIDPDAGRIHDSWTRHGTSSAINMAGGSGSGSSRHRASTTSSAASYLDPPPIYGASSHASAARIRALTGSEVPSLRIGTGATASGSGSGSGGGGGSGGAGGRGRGESFSNSPLRWMADMVGWGGMDEDAPEPGPESASERERPM